MSTFKRLISSIIVFALFSQTVAAGTFWIDTNADNDPNTCVEDETDNDNDCTLRDAISQLTSSDTIRFIDNENQAITFGGTTYTMSVNGVTLDAVTGTSHTVSIDGNGSANNGFSVTGDNITIKGLYLYNFDGDALVTKAIDITSTADSTTIDQNVMGLQTDGTTVNANTKGIAIDGNDASITNNTMSGNTVSGLVVMGNATDITITGNKIGTDVVGNTDKGNGGDGIWIVSGATNDLNGGNGGVEGLVIGGGTSALRNVISGNDSDGIQFGMDANDTVGGTVKIQGNYIGVGANGTTSLGNTGSGILTKGGLTGGASNSLLIGTDGDGTTDTAEANLINNNGSHGISTEKTISNLTIAGNTIKSNTTDGINVNSATVSGTITIGGDDAASAERNIIGSNGDEGIEIADAGSSPAAVTIRNNYIGVDSDGSTARANTGNGVEIADGAALSVVDNTIANSAGAAGILVSGGTSLTFTGNKVGTTAAGTSPAGNTGGLSITASTLTSVVIGGITAALSNIFAASTTSAAGISITGLAANDTSVTIQGNYVGVCADITTGETVTSNLSTCKNGGIGMDLQKGAITIGGDNSLAAAGTGTIAAGNVISNNTGVGIKLSSNVSSATIYGNIIGLIRSGSAGVFNVAAPNDTDTTGDSGVLVNSSVITSFILGAVGSSEASSKRNVISGNNSAGVSVSDMAAAGTATVKNNYIGTDWLGSTAKANGNRGLDFGDGATITIGGTGTSEGNVISGNTSDGVAIVTTADDANIYGNIIGLSADKTADLGNGGDGIEFGTTVTNTVNLGSTTSGGTNYISGNSGNGVNVTSTNTATMNILNNIFGLNGAGTAAIANTSSGLLLNGSGTTFTVGDGTSSGRNVISGNGSYGIYSQSATSLAIKGNYIGLGSDGSTVISNSDNGIRAFNGGSAAFPSITTLTIGGSGDNKNKISNSSKVGFYSTGTTAGITASNESTLDTDNTWTVTSNLAYNFWERWVAGVLTAYGPKACYDGLDNDNDGFVDYLSDSGCSGYTDNDEYNDTGSVGGGGGGGGHGNNDDDENDEVLVEDDSDDSVVDGGVVNNDSDNDSVDHDAVLPDVDGGTDTVVSTTDNSTAVLDSLTDAISTTKKIINGGFVKRKKKVKNITVYLDEYELAKSEIDEVQLTGDQKMIFSALDNIDNQTKLNQAKKVIEKGLKQAVSLGACGEAIKLFGEEIVLDENTDVDFYWSVEEARQSFNDDKGKRTKRLSYHPSTDSNRDGIADVLALVDGRNILTDCAISLNDQYFFTGGLYKIYMAYQDLLPEVPRITNLNNPYNSDEPLTVGSQVMLWIGGRNIGEDIDVFVVDAETLEEYHAGEIELDQRNRAGYLLDFEEVIENFGEEQKRMYIVVQDEDGEGSIEEVIVDPTLELEAQSVHLIRGRVISVEDGESAGEPNFNESLYTTVLLASQSVETQEDDEPYILTGYAEPGSLVYVTWKSLTYSSVAIADASQGYFEIEAPEELEDGDHEVVTYLYNRKNFLSNITQLLFSK